VLPRAGSEVTEATELKATRALGATDSAAPALSVILVSFECRELLRDCLESLASERTRLALEVLLVDNGSRDGTLAMVDEEFSWVRVIARGRNLGFAKANNLATAAARGGHLLYLNPDTVIPPHTLAQAVAALDQHPEVGMLGCKLVRPDGTLDHACKRGFPTPLSSLYHFVGLTRLRPTSRRFAGYTAGWLGANEQGQVDAVNGAFMLVRRGALEAVGPMDETYWLYMEDLDWCYRFWQAGWPVLYWPEVKVIHAKGGSTPGSRPWRQNYAFHRGMWHFYRKHYAADRSPLVTLAVWIGIWTKLAVSATRSIVTRSRKRMKGGR
jgi:GT2 family glycosyltransferase